MLIVVIILNFLNAALNVYFIVNAFLYSKMTQWDIVTIVYDCISVLGFIASSGLLIYSIKDKGLFFNQRSHYYYAAITISICMSLFSVSSVLLVITLFMSDMVWVKPHDDVYFEKKEEKQKEENKMSDKTRERKIASLRELRDKGLITEEEFKEELFKLL